jgi:hypothetical protein
MQRALLAFSGIVFVGSSGAFFLFLPLRSIATVVLILVGLVVMYGLGFPTERSGTKVHRLPVDSV